MNHFDMLLCIMRKHFKYVNKEKLKLVVCDICGYIAKILSRKEL